MKVKHMHAYASSRRSRLASALGCAVLGAVLAGCPPPAESGDSGVDAGCAGTIGCECVAGACSTGECLAGACVDCRRGAAACTCRSNGTCDANLRCATSGLCESCPAGQRGCACDTGDACGTGLVCSSNVCVDNTCVDGTAACPCRGTDPKCDAAMYCDGMTLCQACSSDVVGCACAAGGTCTGGLVCDSSTTLCRVPLTCAQLATAGTCLPNQACTEGVGADAQCTPNTCAPQYKWTGVSCVACASLDCQNEPSCTADGGLATTCAAQNRTCVQMGQLDACGPCVSGFAANPAGACVPVPTCGSTTCAVDQYCDTTSTPTCRTLPCAAGQAKDSSGVCTACAPNPVCTGAGFSGRTWPFKAPGDVCICETLDNYYLPAGGVAAAALCDADDDGWVQEQADSPTIRGSPALRDNARCKIKIVDRVRLTDEYGISVDVLSCAEGLRVASVRLPDGGYPTVGLPLFADGGLATTDAGCASFVPLRLLETYRNDTPGNPSGIDAPAYGSASGRLLAANELNSLTKGCSTLGADYNDDKIPDVEQLQGIIATSGVRPTPEPDRQRLESFAYFMELNSAWADNGVLHIRERSRCAADFPLRYDPAVRLDGGMPVPSDLYTFTNDNPYWRSCQRNRDPLYAAVPPTGANTSETGFDFAQYSCAQLGGTCTLVPPAHPSEVAPTDPSQKLLRDIGLCRLAPTDGGFPARPLDGRWRGMNHHSQFKCVSVVLSTPTRNFEKQAAAFGNTNGLLTYNNCVAVPCATPGPGCTRPQGTGKQTQQPTIQCRAQAGQPTTGVGFAAVNYRPYWSNPNQPGTQSLPITQYQGGCVNEDNDWWTYMCPYPEFTVDAARRDIKFGRYSCYKFNPNFLWAGGTAGANLGNLTTFYWGVNRTDGGSVQSYWGPRPPPTGGL